MTDTYRYRGPLGRGPETFSASLGRVCVTLTFDKRRRIVATCSSFAGPRLFMFDPDTLDTLAELAMRSEAVPDVPLARIARCVSRSTDPSLREVPS